MYSSRTRVLILRTWTRTRTPWLGDGPKFSGFWLSTVGLWLGINWAILLQLSVSTIRCNNMLSLSCYLCYYFNHVLRLWIPNFWHSVWSRCLDLDSDYVDSTTSLPPPLSLIIVVLLQIIMVIHSNKYNTTTLTDSTSGNLHTVGLVPAPSEAVDRRLDQEWKCDLLGTVPRKSRCWNIGSRRCSYQRPRTSRRPYRNRSLTQLHSSQQHD